MNANDPAVGTPNPGDTNVERLLDQAYDPPVVPAEVGARVRARLLAVAAESRPTIPAAPWRLTSLLSHRFARVAAAAALVAALVAGFYFLTPPPRKANEDTPVSITAPKPQDAPDKQSDWLPPSPLPSAPAAQVVAPGSSVAT